MMTSTLSPSPEILLSDARLRDAAELVRVLIRTKNELFFDPIDSRDWWQQCIQDDSRCCSTGSVSDLNLEIDPNWKAQVAQLAGTAPYPQSKTTLAISRTLPAKEVTR